MLPFIDANTALDPDPSDIALRAATLACDTLHAAVWCRIVSQPMHCVMFNSMLVGSRLVCYKLDASCVYSAVLCLPKDTPARQDNDRRPHYAVLLLFHNSWHCTHSLLRSFQGASVFITSVCTAGVHSA